MLQNSHLCSRPSALRLRPPGWGWRVRQCPQWLPPGRGARSDTAPSRSWRPGPAGTQRLPRSSFQPGGAGTVGTARGEVCWTDAASPLAAWKWQFFTTATNGLWGQWALTQGRSIKTFSAVLSFFLLPSPPLTMYWERCVTILDRVSLSGGAPFLRKPRTVAEDPVFSWPHLRAECGHPSPRTSPPPPPRGCPVGSHRRGGRCTPPGAKGPVGKNL